MLLPTGKSCEDSWVVASALAPLTERLRFLVAVRPGLQSPGVAARMTATLDRISRGRLLINVVTGGDPIENKGDGIFLSHDERYEVTREFLDVYRALLAGETVNYSGKHIRIEDGQLLFEPVQKPLPPLYFGGSSDAGIDVAAEQVDKYLTWGEPPAQVGEKIETVTAGGAQEGAAAHLRHPPARHRARDQRGGLGGGRPADQPSRRRDDRLGAERLQAHGLRSARAAWRRCMAGGATSSRSARTSGPASGWCAAARARRWSAIPRRSPTRMKEYMALGIDTFILSGYPHLEEAYRFAELVMPLLPLAHEPERRRAGRRQYGAIRRDDRQRHPPDANGGSASHDARSASPGWGRRRSPGRCRSRSSSSGRSPRAPAC